VTIVVTGASGFVGAALVRRLSTDKMPTVAVGGPRGQKPEFNSAVTWISYRDDFTDLASRIAEHRPTTVVHCATHYVLAHKPSDIEPMLGANLHFGTQLLESLGVLGTHFVNLSTFFQHQRTATGDPTSLYAASKLAFSSIARWYGANTNIKVADLTLFDTYGPGDRRKKLIPSLLASAQSGETLRLHSASAEVDLCYVDDVVSAIAQVMHGQLTGNWSVRSQQPVTVADIAREIESVTGRHVVSGFGDGISVAELPADTPPLLAGWQPTVGLCEGITRCWEAIQASA